MRSAMAHIQVCLVEASIFFIKTDVIVCPVDPDLDLSKYHLSRELCEKAPALQEQLLRQRPNGARYYEHIHLSADSEKLQFKEILFIVCAPYLGKFSEQKLLDAFKRLLRVGEQIRADSIAFPAIGCGKLNYSLETVIIQLLKASDLHCTSQSSSLRKVFFAVPNAADAKEFMRIKSLYNEAKPQRTKNVTSKGPSKTALDADVYFLNEKHSKSFTVTGNKNFPRSDNCLHLLFEKMASPNRKSKTEKKLVPQKKKDVVKNDVSQISEDFLTALFHSAHDETTTILITIEQKDAERLREFADVVVKAFKLWCDNSIGGSVTDVIVHIDDNSLETFCTAVIEALYPITRPSLRLSLETVQPQQQRVVSDMRVYHAPSRGETSNHSRYNDICKSQFDGMAHSDAQRQHAMSPVSITQEQVNTDGRMSAIQAQSKWVQSSEYVKDDDLPDTWKLCDDFGPILLDSHSTEYRDVESEFMHTAGASAEAVVKIERIQDPYRWRQFKAHEIRVTKNVESSRYPVSRRLWHGTSAAAVSKMVKSSEFLFDRNYVRDQALYGKGSYFATDASYAAQPQYAVRSADGTGQVFLALVLTGRFTKGSPEIQNIPERQGAEGLIFDTTVDNELDPNIFVTYHDAQAYPLYLVTFY